MADPTELTAPAPTAPLGGPAATTKRGPTLVINGRRVTVDESFLRLSPEEQNRTVDEIAQSLGMTPDTAAPTGKPWEKYQAQAGGSGFTEEQLKEAARKALANGNTASAKRLVDAARRAGATAGRPGVYTEEQLKEAARKAYAAGDTAAAEELFREAKRLYGAGATTTAPPANPNDPTSLGIGARRSGTTPDGRTVYNVDGAATVQDGTRLRRAYREDFEAAPAIQPYADGDPRNPVHGVPEAAPQDSGLLETIMGTPEEFGRGLQLGVQATGRGLADLAGAAGDLSTGATNLALAGVDNLTELILGDAAPDALDYRFAPSPVGSDAIASAASQASEAAGFDLIDKADMTPGERIRYEMGRFATSALAGGTAMSAKAAPFLDDLATTSRLTGQPATAGQNVTRVALEPYVSAPGRVVAGDMAAGAGAGAGVGAVDEFLPEDSPYKPLASFFASLLGGLGGAGTLKLAAEGVPAAVQSLTGRAKDWTLPLPTDGSGPVTKRIADAAARVAQGMATDLPKARATLAENLSKFPSPGAPKPGPMSLTEDLGLRGLERGYRNSKDPALTARLEAQDQGAMDYATDRLLSILDEGADQPGTLDAIRARPGELRAARDEAALPILRTAQEAGVTVDVKPVADMLDAAMQGPKRPEILRALKAARDSLTPNGKGEMPDVPETPTGPQASNVLDPFGRPMVKPAPAPVDPPNPYDTTVAGLYESRKAINDLIDGRSESNTGKFAQRELIAAKNALDEALADAVPEFRDYLDTFRAESRPLDVFEGSTARNLLNTEADLRNVAARILSPSRYGTEKEMDDVLQMIGSNPEAKRGWRAAVADVLVDRVTRNRAGEEINPGQVVSVYNQHRDKLASVFSPEDMKALDEVHNLVRLLDQPQTEVRTPNLTVNHVTDPLSIVQAGLLATGRDMITTTMIVARLNFAARFLGLSKLTTPHKVNEVLTRMQFDPDLATAILNRPVSEGTGPTWSRDLQKLLAASEAGRQMSDTGEEDETVGLIMGDQ